MRSVLLSSSPWNAAMLERSLASAVALIVACTAGSAERSASDSPFSNFAATSADASANSVSVRLPAGGINSMP